MAKKKQNFEDAMRRLEEIVSALSDGNLPLDDMMKLYEEGRALSRTCLAQLKAAWKPLNRWVAKWTRRKNDKPGTNYICA